MWRKGHNLWYTKYNYHRGKYVWFMLTLLKIEHRSADSSRSIPGHKTNADSFIYIWQMYSFEGSPFMVMFSHFIFRFSEPNLNTDFWWNKITYWLPVGPAGARRACREGCVPGGGGTACRGSCMAGGHACRGRAWPGWGVHAMYAPRPDTTKYGRSMSGRYASYWNALLFGKMFAKNCMKSKEFERGAYPLVSPLHKTHTHTCTERQKPKKTSVIKGKVLSKCGCKTWPQNCAHFEIRTTRLDFTGF